MGLGAKVRGGSGARVRWSGARVGAGFCLHALVDLRCGLGLGWCPPEEPRVRGRGRKLRVRLGNSNCMRRLLIGAAGEGGERSTCRARIRVKDMQSKD